MLFTGIAVLGSIGLSLMAAEAFLRFRLATIEESDRLDPGLIQYDELLGWRLTPNWHGHHRHQDFHVNYAINAHGYRGDFFRPSGQTGRTHAILGDSFAFGLGVNDHETFVHILDSGDQRPDRFLNFSIPGFSTDQEYLLLRDRVLRFLPDGILLVVYLGNDLLDNESPFPLQADNAKPYYSLSPDGIVLKNNPVPRVKKPGRAAEASLHRAVLGGMGHAGNPVIRFLSRSALFRLLNLNPYREPDLLPWFDKRFAVSLALFSAILEKVRILCIANDVELTLALMPGKSYIQNAGSASAQYQEYLRKAILEELMRRSVNAVDLAGLLRSRYKQRPGRWFHPNEGHLTADGHRIVAGILDEYYPR